MMSNDKMSKKLPKTSNMMSKRQNVEKILKKSNSFDPDPDSSPQVLGDGRLMRWDCLKIAQYVAQYIFLYQFLILTVENSGPIIT
jgi:hypothetical protein